MATIPESVIREEKYGGAAFSLSDFLNSIPLTKDQRDRIDGFLSEMKSAFKEANNS